MVMGILGIATLAHANTTTPTDKIETKATAVHLSLEEVADQMGEEAAELESLFGVQTQTVKVYNASNELVAEGELNAFGQTENEQLANALRNASRLMSMGDTHYYRQQD